MTLRTDAVAEHDWVVMPRVLTPEMARRAQDVLSAATMSKKEGLYAEYAAMVAARPEMPHSAASSTIASGRMETALVAIVEIMAPLAINESLSMDDQFRIRRIVANLLMTPEDAPVEDDFPEMRAKYKFVGDPATTRIAKRLKEAAVAEPDEGRGSLVAEAEAAIRALSDRVAELEDSLAFIAENGEHFIIMTSSDDHEVLSDKYERLLRKYRKLMEQTLEADIRS